MGGGAAMTAWVAGYVILTVAGVAAPALIQASTGWARAGAVTGLLVVVAAALVIVVAADAAPSCPTPAAPQAPAGQVDA